MNPRNVEIAFVFWEMNNALQYLDLPWDEICRSNYFAESLRVVDEPVDVLAEAGQLMSLKWAGQDAVDAALEKDICDVLETGTCSTLARLEREIPAGPRSLLRAGLYPPTVKHLDGMGIHSADALDAALESDISFPVLHLSGQVRAQVEAYRIAKRMGWQMGSISRPPALPDGVSTSWLPGGGSNREPADWSGLSVRERFARADADHLMLKHTCEAQVTGWVWYTRATYEPTPHELILTGNKRGRRMKTRPPPDDGRNRRAQYGLDANGRYVVRRVWGYHGRGYSEEFFLWQTPRRLETVSYTGCALSLEWEDPPVNVRRILHDSSGRVMRVEAAYQNGRDSTTDYHYDEKALVCIGDGPLAQSLEYDTRGKLVAIHQGSVRRVLDPQ